MVIKGHDFCDDLVKLWVVSHQIFPRPNSSNGVRWRWTFPYCVEVGKNPELEEFTSMQAGLRTFPFSTFRVLFEESLQRGVESAIDSLESEFVLLPNVLGPVLPTRIECRVPAI